VSISSLSFWQQNANYWNRAQQRDQQLAQNAALMNAMGDAVKNLSSGLAGIANQTALNRVNSQLTAAVQSALQQTSGGSTSSSQTGSSSSSPSSSGTSSTSNASSSASSSTSSNPTPATGTGTVPLTSNTSLLTLGIPKDGAILVSDGTNVTTYKSTGDDTVTDLLRALNTNAYGNAQVNAWLDGSGKLVVAAKDTTSPLSVGGTFASNVGFGPANSSFQPTTPTPATSSGTSSTASSSSSATSSNASTTSGSGANGSSTGSSATSTSSQSALSGLRNSAYALQTSGTAEFLLAANGLAGTTLNLLT